ncbi:hypothetical protein H5410_056840 [Solanum commersonii]|uniref:Uncharacterized protein n=1 Tax=Solanum commersonii TaxID=4109 RepID=A0A9J5WMF4_SOLCO|nr:hypothetical protein H5410_056840 [Solanum commersonii]
MNGYNLPIQGYQGKPPHHARPSYHGRNTLMQVQDIQGRFKLTFERVRLLNPRLSMRSSTQATMHVARPPCLGLHELKESPRAFPRVVVFTIGHEVARKGEPNLRQPW